MTNYTCQTAILCFTSGSRDIILHQGDQAELDESDPMVRTYVARKLIEATSSNSTAKTTQS